MLLALLLIASGLGPAASAEEPALVAPPMVEWVALCAPSAVDLMIINTNRTGIYWGAGVIIHEAGYILTANHVVARGGHRKLAQRVDQKEHPFRTVATMYEYDLAVVKMDRDEPFPAVKLGRSDRVQLGQPVLIFGNPGGHFHSVSPGVISGLHRGGDDYFQTNAPINPGNSGGPAYDGKGRLLGLIQIKQGGLENVGYITPVDHVRKAFEKVLLDEQRSGLRTGLTIDIYGPAKVTAVRAGGPADRAGLQVGDLIRRAGKLRVDDSIHYCLALLELKPGQALPLEVERDGELLRPTITLEEAPLLEAVQVDEAQLRKGLRCNTYFGEWEKLPDFDTLKPVSSKVVPKVGLHQGKDRKDHFGLQFTGYLAVPSDGLYTFYTASDDGTKLWIDGRLVVDNDGLHPTAEKGGYVRLRAGNHSLKLTFFEARGDEAVKVLYEGPKLKKTEIPASALFTPKESANNKGK